MFQFQRGDKVRIIGKTTGCTTFGELCTLRKTDINIDEEIIESPIDNSGEYRIKGYYFKQEDLRLISRPIERNNKEKNNITKKIMSLIEKIKLAKKAEPEKSLIMAGLLDAKDETLTEEGKEVLTMILVEENKLKLKEYADIILAEKKNK